MSKKDGKAPPKSGNPDAADNGDDADDGDADDGPRVLEAGQEDAAEILADLLRNQGGGGNGGTSSSAATTSAGNTQVGEAQQAAIQQMMQQLKLGGSALPNATAANAAGGTDEEKKHAFWDTQPMLNSEENDERTKRNKVRAMTYDPDSNPDPNWHKPIIPDKDSSELRADPYNMPKGFQWSEVDITDPAQRTEIYDLLYQNYVEDDECMFRFDYSRDFLTWALTPPGFRKDFHLGVRSTKSNRLMAFITGVPARVRVHHVAKDMVEVNFLCVHKKLRSKRLAPVLIKEITRRVNHAGMFQAAYTAGVVLPGHVASCRYYHRTLDARKLVEIGFTRLHARMTMARMQKLYKLPTQTALKGLRPMTEEDVPSAHKLVSEYLERFKLSVVFSEEEFAHWLLPREGVVSSFVNVQQTEGGEAVVTDFCSYYHLHSSVLGNAKHNTLHAAYSFYNVATTVDLTELMRDCLILAKNEGHDVFNALNLMENERFLNDLKFGVGDGNLQYYVYNWLCPTMEHGDVGLVLL